MKRVLTCFLCFAMMIASSSVLADGDLNQTRETTESLWRRGAGAEDGAFSAVSTSMLGWGLGLAAVIAILASVLHQSSAANGSHAHAHSCP